MCLRSGCSKSRQALTKKHLPWVGETSLLRAALPSLGELSYPQQRSCSCPSPLGLLPPYLMAQNNAAELPGPEGRASLLQSANKGIGAARHSPGHGVVGSLPWVGAPWGLPGQQPGLGPWCSATASAPGVASTAPLRSQERACSLPLRSDFTPWMQLWKNQLGHNAAVCGGAGLGHPQLGCSVPMLPVPGPGSVRPKPLAA